MRIQISVRDFEITKPLKEYCQEKIGRLARFDQEILHAHIRIERNRHHKHGDVFNIAIQFALRGTTIDAETSAGDPYAAIDLAQEKLERELEHWRAEAIIG